MIVVNFMIVFIIFGLCVLFSVLCFVSVVIEERQSKICMCMENLVVNVVGVVELVLNSVISNFFLRLFRKDKDKKCKEGEDERSNNENVGLEFVYVS